MNLSSALCDVPCISFVRGLHYDSQLIKSTFTCVDRYLMDLPLEVWMYVCALLPSRDRKNTRLVCRTLNEANNVVKLLRREKFVCLPFYDVEEFFRTLAKSGRKILNLEFQYVTFDGLWDVAFWREQGSRVRFLKFEHCVLSSSRLPFILHFCDNLEGLSLQFQLTAETHRAALNLRSLPRFPSLSKLLTLKVETPNVNHQMCLQVFCEVANLFFITYPCLKHVSLVHLWVDDSTFTDNVESDEEWDEELIPAEEPLSSISRIFVHLRAGLESITIGQSCFKIWKTFLELTFPKLKKLGLHLLDHNYVRQLENHLLTFFRRHPGLTHVKIYVKESFHPSSKWNTRLEKLIHCLLDSCPNLHSLRTNFPTERSASMFSVDRRLHEKLLKSKLISLDFRQLLVPTKIPADAATEAKVINQNLKYLEVRNQTPRCIISIVDNFSGLTHLAVAEIDDCGLQYIIQRLSRLKSLKFKGLSSRLTEHGFTVYTTLRNGKKRRSTGYSIRNLDKLEYFCMDYEIDSDNSCILSEEALTHFNCLNIVYLDVCIHLRESLRKSSKKLNESYVPNFSQLSQLEVLKLSFCAGTQIHQSFWIEMCSGMKKLQILMLPFVIIDPDYESDEDDFDFDDYYYDEVAMSFVIRLFECCPTLRIVSFYDWQADKHRSYYFDRANWRITRNTSNSDDLRLFVIAAAKVGGFSVTKFNEVKGFCIWF